MQGFSDAPMTRCETHLFAGLFSPDPSLNMVLNLRSLEYTEQPVAVQNAIDLLEISELDGCPRIEAYINPICGDKELLDVSRVFLYKSSSRVEDTESRTHDSIGKQPSSSSIGGPMNSDTPLKTIWPVWTILRRPSRIHWLEGTIKISEGYSPWNYWAAIRTEAHKQKAEPVVILRSNTFHTSSDAELGTYCELQRDGYRNRFGYIARFTTSDFHALPMARFSHVNYASKSDLEIYMEGSSIRNYDLTFSLPVN